MKYMRKLEWINPPNKVSLCPLRFLSMNIHEKKLIEGLLDTSDKARHDKAVEMLFFGRDYTDPYGKKIHREEEVTRSIRRIVAISFTGSAYAEVRDQIYPTFVSLFYKYLMNIKPETFFSVDNLPAWMRTTARHYANRNREEINDLLGIYSDTVPLDNEKMNRLPEGGDEEGARNTVEPGSTSRENSSKWAEDKLANYINKIHNAYYREILTAVDIAGMELEDFAEEQGKSIAAIYNDHRRARIALIQIALPDIRKRAASMYGDFKDQLTEKERKALDGFFLGSGTEDSATIAIAYSKLLKIARRESLAAGKAERREMREERRRREMGGGANTMKMNILL